MTDEQYIAKLEEIRDQWRQGHRGAVLHYPADNPGQALQEIVRSYEMVEALERILASEKAKTEPERPGERAPKKKSKNKERPEKRPNRGGNKDVGGGSSL